MKQVDKKLPFTCSSLCFARENRFQNYRLWMAIFPPKIIAKSAAVVPWENEEECGLWRAIFPPNIIAKSLISNLEEDEEKGLDEAEHGAAHEHHDEEDDARDAAEDRPQALHRVRVLWQPDILEKKRIFKGTVSGDARHAAEDRPQALHRVRVLRQPDVLRKKEDF
jgi:hypothetical protein